MRIRTDLRRIAARKSILVLLLFPSILALLTFWGTHGEINDLDAAQKRGLELTERAFSEGRLTSEELEAIVASSQEQQRILQTGARAVAFPSSIQFGLQSFATGGTLFLALASVLVVGSEFGWGNYRNKLALGATRVRILGNLFLALLALSGLALLVTAAVSALAGLFESFVTRTGSEHFYVNLPGLLGSIAGASLASLVWISAGLVIAVTFGRGIGVSVATCASVWIGQLIVSGLIPEAYSWSLETHIMSLLLVDTYGWPTGMTSLAGVNFALIPGPGRAVGFLVAFCALASALAFWRFQRIDIP
jgi:ABC-type transport system involved in multi-copper enzyme maturation permease subunit